jgi:[protein-PII] uridylyltransferase
LGSSDPVVEEFMEAREALIQKDLIQSSGFLAARRYTDLMDRFILTLFLAAGLKEKAKEISEERIAIVALGSYGRREICLGSDVDLLVAHQGKLSTEMDGLITKVLHSLWDAKLEVGHAVLTVQECNRLAMSDFRFLTSVLDSRFLMGSRSFFRLFDGAFWSKIDREKETLLKEFLIYQQKREEKYVSQEYLMEPDIKEGLGGLRDMHFMAWVAKIYFKCRHLRQIRRLPVFSYFGLDKLHDSESFVLKVRSRLHLLAGGRREDRLLLPFQERVSRNLGYENGAHNTGPERFMRDLYLHLNRIRYGSEEFHRKAMDIIDPQPVEPPPNHLSPEFEVMKGTIGLKQEGLLQKGPMIILKAFEEANRRGLSLGSGFIWQASKRIAEDGKELFSIPEARKLFLDLILNPQNPKILRLALEIGLVSLFIPEFKKIRNLAQFSYYHIETVDLHSLRTLETIQEISKGNYNDRWPLLQEVSKELKHPDWLFLAGLLHDIGKGYRGDHAKRGAELIPRILKRLGLSGEVLRVLRFLVKHHLRLANVSQRRDLNDEKTAIQVAQNIGDPEKLRLLFLLTIADSIATGPMASGDWKMMLLIELYFKTKHILERGTLASPDATKTVDENKRNLYKALRPQFERKDIIDLMDQISARYFLNTPMEDMIQHFLLALNMGDRRFSWALQKLKDVPVTRVILCTYDKPGLFCEMVGVFTLNNIKVLSGNIFTLKNGLAFDTYEVTNPLDPYREKEMWDKIFNDAVEAIEERLPLDAMIIQKERMALRPTAEYGLPLKRVLIDNEDSDFFTIVEVSAGGRTGLLYDLAKEIFRFGLDIRFAKVHTDKERMTGVFYVRDASGQKVYEEEVMAQIKECILSVMK